tara:strand:- start:100 stop:399 length:300 start_codon:yes stop_codon:yes gene_type:complete
MNQSIKAELLDHISEFNGLSKNHFTMFNEDYYIIGYYQAEQWLKRHNIGTFEGIEICNDYEREHFGEVQSTFEDAEKLVNHLVYWFGQDLCNELELPNE